MENENPLIHTTNPGQHGWERKKVLIAVRTYPTPAQKGVEVSCTAGVTEAGNWIRLFPVPYRLLDNDKRFKKWQWMEVDVQRSSDMRPESFRINSDSIVVGPTIPSKRTWDERKTIIEPLRSASLCQLQRQLNVDKSASTLGIFRPKSIQRLVIEPESEDWSESQLLRLRQLLLFGNAPKNELEKIPFKFSYEFICDEPSCSGHKLSCTDWEMAQAYRGFKSRYGMGWEDKFRQKFEDEMTNKCETSFFVGTVHNHPNSWIIIGLWYPRLT
ncbi:hypothetical protein JYT32_00925 [Dehalococcoides mccartyi]|nr:hypothetical protein [Dehalococcoides mccartyi]